MARTLEVFPHVSIGKKRGRQARRFISHGEVSFGARHGGGFYSFALRTSAAATIKSRRSIKRQATNFRRLAERDVNIEGGVRGRGEGWGEGGNALYGIDKKRVGRQGENIWSRAGNALENFFSREKTRAAESASDYRPFSRDD